MGLNLLQAGTVIHVTDRADRMGQQSTAFVHGRLSHGAMEVPTVALRERAALTKGLHADAQSAATRRTNGELNWLPQPIGAAVQQGEVG